MDLAVGMVVSTSSIFYSLFFFCCPWQAHCGVEWRSRACGAAGCSGSKVPPCSYALLFTWTPNILACAQWSSICVCLLPMSTALTPSILSLRRQQSAFVCLQSLRVTMVRPMLRKCEAVNYTRVFPHIFMLVINSANRVSEAEVEAGSWRSGPWHRRLCSIRCALPC